MRLDFTKMHGLGNDFVVVDGVSQPVNLSVEQLKLLGDRRRGVGCDQILVVEPPREPAADFYYRIYNQDGSLAEMCGNGARCFARFAREQGLTDKDRQTLETLAGPVHVVAMGEEDYSVDMGPPRFEPAEIPFRAEARALSYPLEVAGEMYEIGAVSMGNPHAVLRVDDVDTAPVERLGPLIEPHHRFPNRVNVGFMQVVDRGHIRLRVFERGAGETLACGTGACAAVAVGRVQGLLDERVAVDLPGGRLMISWPGENQSVWMTGPATRVFDGRIEL